MAKESQLGWMVTSHDEARPDPVRERMMLLADFSAGLIGAFGVSPAPAARPAPAKVDNFTAWSLCPNCGVGAVHLLGERLHTPTGQGRFQAVLAGQPVGKLMADTDEDKVATPMSYRKAWHDEVLESIQRECRSCRHVWNEALGWTWTETKR